LRFLSRAEPFFVLVAVPALLFPSPLSVLAAAPLPLSWMVRLYHGERVIETTPLDPAILLIVVATLLSAVLTYDVGDSAGKLAGLALGVCIYYVTVRYLGRLITWETGVAWYAVAGVLVTVLMLVGTLWAGKWPLLTTLARGLPAMIRGIPGAERGFHPNAAAGTLLFFLPLLIAWVWSLGGWRRRAGWIVVAASSGTLLLTQSRTAWLALLIAAMAWSYVHFRWMRWTTGGLLIVAITAALLAPTETWSLLATRLAPATGGDIGSRLEVQQRGLIALRDQPLTGTTMNGFRRTVGVLYPLFTTPSTADVAHAHNQMLQVTLDLGLLGLAGYTALWVGAGVMITMAWRRAHNRRRRVLEALAATLVAHFAFGIADAIPLGAKVSVIFWVLLALCVAAFRETPHESAT